MDIITLEAAVEEIREAMHEASDARFILEVYKKVCWENSELKDGKILIHDVGVNA